MKNPLISGFSIRSPWFKDNEIINKEKEDVVMVLCRTADEQLEVFLQEQGEETSFHRVAQQKVKCGFGLQGVCCKLCTNGPCRITPDSPCGVCGATADTIVARNFLRTVAAGSACYLHVVENAARELQALARNGDEIRSEATLQRLVEMMGIEEKDPHQQALLVSEKVLEDLYRPREEKMELVKRLSYSPRYHLWEKLNILPGGAKAEVFDALVKSSTNLNSDPQDMLLHVLNLGISTGIYGLTLTNLLNDVIIGEPSIYSAKTGFRVVDPDYINILVTGHQHALFRDLQDQMAQEETVKLAKKAGAKGFCLVGSTCVGQDMEIRKGSTEKVGEVYCGHTGNNFTSEPLLQTGAIDLIASEFNCTLPGLERLSETYQIKMVYLDDVAKKATAEKPEDHSEDILKRALESYQERRGQVKISIPQEHGNPSALTGITETSLKKFLGDTYQPILDLITSGKIRGIAGVVGCSNLTTEGHDVFTVKLTKELIKKNILVLTAGCTSGGLANVGLTNPEAAREAGENLQTICRELGIPPVLNFGPCLSIGRLELVVKELAEALDVDLPALPVVLSAPQWLEEQALADGAFALALGLTIHLAQPPFILGGKTVTQVLTKELKNLTGGRVLVEGDVKKAAQALALELETKRDGLGI